MKRRTILYSLLILCFAGLQAQELRSVRLLDSGWKFRKGDEPKAMLPKFSDAAWERVTAPHDWAIYGPFDSANDRQEVAITQNWEAKASVKTGRTGGLPYVGVGWYRLQTDVSGFVKGQKRATLVFDGAMSEAQVYVNGKEACFWAYGYNSFYTDITDLLTDNGKSNLIAVRLENRPLSSRWYPGAGLYRNVHLVVTNETHIPVWGTYITTPYVTKEYATVKLKTEVANANGTAVRIVTEIRNQAGVVVARKDNTQRINHDMPLEQNFTVEKPHLWSPETPYLYSAVSKIYVEGKQVDEYSTRLGIRDIRVEAEKGFFLNGERRKFQGVCNHHDLGPLGAAVNRAALRRQLTLLKDMGCDAIRTTHNMPAPELVELCDEMGFMMIIEPFDEWDIAKCANGYHRFFNEWVEKDMVNMLRHFRNNPCVVMWSIGNEVPTQCSEDGYKVAALLQNICHREDPTRPVTCGMDQADCALNNGFAALLDIPGFNYRLHKYREAYEKLPQNLLLGSETASTISSRGVYKFPVEKKAGALYDDHQCSSYDLEYCRWSNLPDDDFAWADDYEWMMGQFVWTGFDYLGEPTPYDANGWPNHSSMFGIIDLANIPKDRYYLYRSIWNKNENTLHILPHWNWEGREGQTTPVFVYTGYPSAELFINGKSQGKQTKNNSTLQNRYRLMWMDAIYEPGEVKVVAYDAQGKAAEEKTVRTAGKPHHIELLADRTQLSADGKDLAYINVRVVDKDGNLCPNDGQLITFSVKGAGTYRAAANGDPTCLDLFHKPQMHAFGGQLTAIVQSAEKPGKIQFEAEAKGLGKATVVLQSEEKTAYLFSYFKNNGKDGLHLAYSSDGYHWEALNNDQAFLKPELSNDKLMRDPCIIQGNDGLYHLVWTISWEGKGIGYAASKDLISWSEQKIIPVMAHEEGARNCWAPEITYDKANNEYMIYWATTITGRYPSENQQSEDAYNHRIYYVTTRDFTHFSKTKLLYDTGVNVIDATIVPIEGRFVMFLKDETLAPPQKNIRIATSEKLTGPYSELSAPVTGNYWAEGPTVTTIGENWVVYFDKYREGKFGAITSADLKNWKDISDKISLPTGIRHGTIFKVPESSAPLPIRSLRGI